MEKLLLELPCWFSFYVLPMIICLIMFIIDKKFFDEFYKTLFISAFIPVWNIIICCGMFVFICFILVIVAMAFIPYILEELYNKIFNVKPK